ncbi:MAG: mechanosensitive ion channel family protein [Acidobacteriia bacterium]|nr:mechanosensitive ion channel family protein [Terriglobia bacterium]
MNVRHRVVASVRRVPFVVAAVVAAPLTAAVAISLAGVRTDVARYDAINAGLGAPAAGVSRSSPATAWRSYLALASAGKYEQAAHLLDLSATPPVLQRMAGAETAEKLWRVLKLLKAREDAVTTEDEAGPTIEGEPANDVVALRFERGGIRGEVRLRHTVGARPYELAWLFSRETVASVPFWHRVLVKGEAPRGAEPVDVGLGTIPPEVSRTTPREAMAGFLAACQEGRFDLAAFYLDLGAIRQERQREEGMRLARRLMLALQRTGWVDPEKLSNEPLGRPETGVPENEQLFAVVRVGRQPMELLLAHRSDAELGHVWMVSQGTVSLIDRLYDAHGYGWLGDHAPLALFALRIAGLQLWQWLGILVGLVASWFVSRVLGRWAVRLFRRIARRTAAGWDDIVTRALDGPIAFLLAAGILALLARWLGVTPDAWTVARYICKLLALVGVGWFLVRLVDVVATRVRDSSLEKSPVGLGFLPMTVRVAKAVAVVLIGLAALDVIGINVVAGLGALGIGAAALAFAAQKTLENLFGTLSIASDRPFEVGDYVSVGQDSGTVEDVGFRSTRIRTLGRTLVTVPNGLVASGRVENFSARDRIMYNPLLRLAYATTGEQLRAVIDEVGRLLHGHPKVFQGEQRVRFAAFGEYALHIEVWCWVATKDFLEYTEVVEQLNLGIAEIVERSGTSFAFPTRVLVMPKDGVAGHELEARGARADGAVASPEVPDTGGTTPGSSDGA